VAKRREPAAHLSLRPGHRLSAVFVAVACLNAAICAATAQLIDADMQKMLRDHAVLDNEDGGTSVGQLFPNHE